MPPSLRAGGAIAVVEKSDHRVAFYDLDSGALEAVVPCRDFPHEMVVGRDGRTAFVSEYGLANSAAPGDGWASILMIDLAERSASRRLDCHPYARIHGIRLDDSGRLFALSERDDVLMVFDQPETDERPRRAVSTGGSKGHLFALRPDGLRAWCVSLESHTVTSVSPFDGDAAPLALCPGSKPEGICLSRTGDRLFTTSRDDDRLCAICPETMRLLAVRASGRDPTRVYEAPTGALLVTAFGGCEILLHDPETLAITSRIALDASPIAVSFHPDRAEAYVSLASNELLIVDLASLGIRRRLATGLEPDCSALLIRHRRDDRRT